MKRHRLSATWLGAILGTLSALFLFALSAHAADHRGDLTEELHQTYSLTPDGRIELDNINGPVHISTWDRSDVKLDAIKYADTKERLDEAKIEINATRDLISIRTKYPDHDQTFNWGSRHNPATVEYTLKVPRTVRLDEIKLINGSLDITGVQGEVRASCINGYLEANDLGGPARLSTINGRLEAHFGALSSKGLELNSVNGSLELTIPSDAKARIEASTVSGGIDNDFGLHSSRHQWVGHELSGELGSGGPHIKLSNVNGHIEIHHAQDGRTLSPVHDLSGNDDDSI
jgi:Putative adhesin